MKKKKHLSVLQSQAEMQRDIEWAAGRPTVKNDSEVVTHEQVLNETEKKFLAAYRERWPGRAYSLNQNGATSHAMHSQEQHMHTLIANLHFVWCDLWESSLTPGMYKPRPKTRCINIHKLHKEILGVVSLSMLKLFVWYVVLFCCCFSQPHASGVLEGRWLSGTEALVAQGFPVHPIMHPEETKEKRGMNLCSFNWWRPGRQARIMRKQAGNSMHLFAITVQFLYILMHVKVSLPDLSTKRMVFDTDTFDRVLWVLPFASFAPFSLFFLVGLGLGFLVGFHALHRNVALAEVPSPGQVVKAVHGMRKRLVAPPEDSDPTCSDPVRRRIRFKSPARPRSRLDAPTFKLIV